MRYYNVPVVRFYIEDDSGYTYEADDDGSFEDTDYFQTTLRIRNPSENYRMVAIIDA